MLQQQFFSEVVPLLDLYDRDNQWFGFKSGGQAWSSGSWPDFVLAAWKLYDAAAHNQLQSVVLGDTKIRSDAELLMNFGLAANSKGPQEEKDKQMVADLIAKRKGIAEKSAFKKPIAMMGPGSILSAERWSPLLNDALMLGGIRGSQSFYFALNEDEQVAWAQLEASEKASFDKVKAKSEFERRRDVFGASVKTSIGSAEDMTKDLWLKFLQKVPRVLWERGNPRVFVRELLGLKFFGYKPVFSVYGLGFAPGGNGAQATFAVYLAKLHEAGMDTRDRTKLMTELSMFLFNNPSALQHVGA